MAKRAAANYMTDQNWQDEEEPVEAGTFTPASIDVIQKRQIKTAKRKIPNGGQATVSAFKGFSGFTSLTANKPAASAPSFNFGITATGGASAAAKSDFGGATAVTKTNNDPPLTTKTNTNDASNSKYVQQLKRLNESVTQWIKDHVDSNPYCILTPIFRDYERYLGELEKSTNCSESTSASSSSSASSATTPTFKFGSAPLGGASDPSKPLGAASQSSISSLPGDNSKFGGFLTQPLRETSDSADVAPSPFTGFGSPSLTGFGKPSSTSTAPTSLFSFKAETAKASMEAKSSSPFSFAVSKSETDSKSSATSQNSQDNGEEEYEPPKADVTVIKEDDAFYTKRCKLFVQRDNSWKEKGVGNLHLKPCSGKTQLLIRADTSLGTIMLNIMLSSSMPMSRQGKNNVTMICVPNPPLDDENKPVSMLVKVKTGEDADELLAKLTEAKSTS